MSNRHLMCGNRFSNLVSLGVNSIKSAPLSNGIVADIIVNSYLNNDIVLFYYFFDEFSFCRSF